MSEVENYLANCNVTYGCKIKFEPPTNAASHSPFRIALNAQSNAYNELLHAVSNRYEGPVKPKQYEIRFANIARLQLWLENGKQFGLIFANRFIDIVVKHLPSDTETTARDFLIKPCFLRFRETSAHENTRTTTT